MILERIFGTVKTAYAKATEAYDRSGLVEEQTEPEPSRKRRRVDEDEGKIDGHNEAAKVIEKNDNEVRELKMTIEELRIALWNRDQEILHLKEKYGHEDSEDEEDDDEDEEDDDEDEEDEEDDAEEEDDERDDEETTSEKENQPVNKTPTMFTESSANTISNSTNYTHPANPLTPPTEQSKSTSKSDHLERLSPVEISDLYK